MLLPVPLLLGLVGLAAAEPTIYFKEQFLDGDGWTDRWIESKHKPDFGRFVLSSGKFYGDQEKDKGLQTSQDARFYALSARFEPFSNKGQTLVVQFTVKHEQNIDCGGGYVKLFPDGLDQTDMHGDSEYNIMFGPDICGPGTKKVHVIFNYKGKNVLINKDIRCKDDEFTHLYTLIVRPDNTYEVKIDNSQVESGSLEDDWDFLPPKKIKDPDAVKPEDWDERAKIDDPTDSKPEDWDKPEHIPDPDAKKPEDWDEEMDGEWEPPVIQNPEYKGSVCILGSDDATTCHIVVLRHTGNGATCLTHCDGTDTKAEVSLIMSSIKSFSDHTQRGRLEVHLVGGFSDDRQLSQKLTHQLLSEFDRQEDDIHLVTLCVTELNDREENENHFPIIYGIAVNVKTAEIYRASFPDRGPEEELRAARVLTGGPMISIYDAKTEQLRIGPYSWMPFPHVDFWLQQDDKQILENLSTSPLAEPPHFVEHIRSTLMFLKKYPSPTNTLFPGNKALLYKKNEDGLWKEISSGGET